MAKELNISDLQLKYLELETLLDITNDLNSFEEIPVLLQEILVKSCAVLNASSGLILIEDDNSNVLNIGADFNIDISALNGIIFNKNKGVIKEINQSRKTLCFKISQDNYFYGTNCVYCLIAPLLDKQKLAGAIVLFDKESRKGISPFIDSDSNMLSAIASQAGIAYNNIKLIENIKEAKAFNENVMQSIATGVFTTNLMGEINHVNRTAVSILNFDKEYIIGNHYGYIFESNEQILELISKCELESITVSESQVQLQFDDKTTTVNISVSPLLNDFNQPLGTVVALEDLSNINKLKSTFKKYVSNQIVDQLLENEDLLSLGGQEQDATILFSDIRGFTSLSENMTPNEVVETLNDYFNQMIEIIFKYNGILDKIIGDELMVIYGVPKSNIQDSENAVLTAIEMQEKLIAFNQDRCINLKKPIKVGIGVNSGSVISGNIGSTDQMDFTVIGDSVNLASRLCSYAEAGQIIISDAVWNNIKHLQTFKSKKLSPIKVKGKAEVISIKEILYNGYEFDYQDAFNKVEAFLLKELPLYYTYHSIEHFRDVVKQVERIAKKEKIDKAGILDIKLAAWLHDVGYIWGPLDHEEKSVEYAKVILNEMKFPKSKISLITGMIMATKMPQSPKNHFEQIICDADLDYLGRNDFEDISSNLLKELEINQKITNFNWLKIQEKFLKSHSYFTLTSQKSREKNKQKRLTNIQDLLKTYEATRTSRK
ncbi:PAS domain-containing protein [Flavobacteriaceae bacterium]|nr:PAS domain-containing protein [Flavobacteriaceae bacterium]